MIHPAPHFSEHPLYLRYLPGRGDVFVISFSGVGLDPDVVPKVEAVSLTGQQGENHVLFVSDASRSWMNHPGQMALLKAKISQLTDEIEPSRIVAVGNSMGGSCALIYAGEAKVDAVLAIVPQYSIFPGVVRRGPSWSEYTSTISDWPYPAVPDLSGASSDVVILHGTEDGEIMQARKFRQGRNIHHYLFQNIGHDLALRLKANKMLQPIFANLIAGNLPETHVAIEVAGGIPFAQHNRQAKEEKAKMGQH